MEERLRKPGIIFVIVHGTASRRARWIRPDSKIRRRLERHFDRRGHTVSFEWTGDNTDMARLTAGKDLARLILELYEKFHAPIYLVAHSHGGNIALYSMRDPAVEEKIAGVICMGTSFIKCRPRALIPALEKCLELLPRLAGATILGLISLMQTTGMGGRRVAAFPNSVEWCAIFFLGVMVISHKLWMPGYKHSCISLVKGLGDYVRSKSDSTIATLSLPRLPNLKMLCLSSPNDEVDKCLRLSIFFSEIPFFAWRFLNRISDLVIGVGNVPAKLLTVAFYAGVGAAIVCMFHGDRQIAWLHLARWLVIPRLAGLLILIIIAPLLLAGQLLLAMTPRLPGILSHGFGGESILNSWFIRFTAEPAPEEPKDCVVKQMNVVSGKLNFRAPNLRTFWAATAHTRLYNNREVLRETIRWIYKREECRANLSQVFDVQSPHSIPAWEAGKRRK